LSKILSWGNGKSKKANGGMKKMPWIDKNGCTGCGICVAQCPVDAIVMVDEIAEIHMDDCIRCGVCHDVCPEDAVRHDSEKIPDDVNANIEQTKKFMDACGKHLGDEKEKQKCLNRMMKHFKREKIVAEKTLEKLQMLKDE
jgi:ferredoxin